MKYFPTLLEYSTHHAKELRSVFELAGNPNYTAFADTIERGNDFFSQPLALWMFVPCGEDGKPMDKLTKQDYALAGGMATHKERQEFDDYLEYYQAAEQRVLFEGWQIAGFKSDDLGWSATAWNFRWNVRVNFESTGTMERRNIDQYLHNSEILLTPTQSAKDQLNIKED
ncbi:MAG: hypothetical protein GQ553_02560 [Nitrosomonadaceae bacterium]|nr:hypothetical protein [Nitrosomonadaceae bacterium]